MRVIFEVFTKKVLRLKAKSFLGLFIGVSVDVDPTLRNNTPTVIHIWGQREGQSNRTEMEGPHSGRIWCDFFLVNKLFLILEWINTKDHRNIIPVHFYTFCKREKKIYNGWKLEKSVRLQMQLVRLCDLEPTYLPLRGKGFVAKRKFLCTNWTDEWNATASLVASRRVFS